MFSVDSKKAAFWIGFITLVSLLLFVPRGCSSQEGKSQIGQTETLGVNLSYDQSSLLKSKSIIEKRVLSDLFYQKHEKQDYFFVVNNSFEADVDLSQSPLKGAFSLIVSLPGNITSSNADNITDNTATWALSFGKSYQLKAASSYTRWWSVVLVVVSLLLLAYWRFFPSKKI